MNTTENNKLIAEFLHGKNAVHPNQYHENWNELMPVILKINQFENQRYSILINSMDCKIHDNLKNKTIADSFGRFTPDELIKSIYSACVEFIKWYNEQQK